MADNTRGGSNDGTLPLIATDDVGGVQYQRVKLDKGGDGATSPIVDGNPLPVTVETLPTVNLADPTTVVVEPGVNPLDVTGSGVVVTNGTITVDTITDSVLLAAGDNNIGNVDIVTLPALPAGTNNIGDVDVLTLPSIPAGNNNIGDVDIASVPAPLSTTGNGTAATAQRVTIASDSTGTVAVTGTVTANAGTNLNTSALALESGGNLAGIRTAVEIIDDWDESDRAKVNVIVGQAGVAAGTGLVGATTQRMTVGHKNTYVYAIASSVHVAAANTVFLDMFNADASLLVRVMSIKHKPNITTAVTGVVFDWLLERTTAVGTGGTAQTAWLSDLSQTALDADITCRLKPSGGATQSTDLINWSMSSEETNAATIMVASLGGLELVPEYLRITQQGILLRQNQGLRVVQITNSAAGNSGFEIAFTVE